MKINYIYFFLFLILRIGNYGHTHFVRDYGLSRNICMLDEDSLLKTQKHEATPAPKFNYNHIKPTSQGKKWTNVKNDDVSVYNISILVYLKFTGKTTSVYIAL